MRLSKRIYKIAEKVIAGETAADIGTDHGYVPMLLVRGGVSPAVIMSDISAGSLSKAVETFEIAGLHADPDAFRVGDGLDTIQSGEVDDVIIAGLGGFTIIDILQSNLSKSRSFRKLILQPRKHSGNLRYFLYVNGWDIIDEDLAPEGKFVCEVITAVPSHDTLREAPYPEEDIRWKYPEAIVAADPALAHKRISWKISSIDEQLDNLGRSNSDTDSTSQVLRSAKEYLSGLILLCEEEMNHEEA